MKGAYFSYTASKVYVRGLPSVSVSVPAAGRMPASSGAEAEAIYLVASVTGASAFRGEKSQLGLHAEDAEDRRRPPHLVGPNGGETLDDETRTQQRSPHIEPDPKADRAGDREVERGSDRGSDPPGSPRIGVRHVDPL